MDKMRRMQRRKSNVYFLFFVFFTVAIVFGIYSFDSLTIKNDNLHQSMPATFDCSEARSLQKVHRYYLTGDWQFFAQNLIVTEPQENPEPPVVLSVPSRLTENPFACAPFESGGYGSYRCYIENLQTDRAVMIYVPNLTCAYRVYADGVLVTESGRISTAYGENHSSASALKERVYFDEGRHEIIIEVSADFSPGLYLSPILADYVSESNYIDSLLVLRYALIGIILYAAIVMFIFGMISKIRYFSPWLPVLFVLLALRMMVSTEGYSVSQPWFFSISYEKMFWVCFSSTFFIKLVSIIYFRDELKLRVSKKSMVILSALFFLVMLGAFFLPHTAYGLYYSLLLQFLSLTADFYLINKLCVGLAEGKRNAGLFCCAYLFLLCGITIDVLYTSGMMPIRSSSFMPIALALFCLFLTIIHAKNSLDLYMRIQRMRTLERELEKANMAVMISQIQPHFLYNALNTIKSLIRRDPKTAEEAIIDFSYYLRGNMDSLTHTGPIPFRTELQHIRYYCDIELLRFADKLRIEYDILDDDFTVPTLSVQPIVENAIKHGVTKRPEGGVVRISAYEEKNGFVVSVEDNGVGFDPSQLEEEDGRTHVGLPNIRYRFETMMHAKVDIQSEKGVGTTITIHIPRQSDSNHKKGEKPQ